MAKNNNWLIPALIIIGLLIVALSLFFASKSSQKSLDLIPLAKVEINLGGADIYRAGVQQREAVHIKGFLYNLDSLETRADGDATLEFDSGYRIRVPENSLVTLSSDGPRTLLLLKRGEVFVENYGQEGSVFISADGKHWSATDYETKYKAQQKGGLTQEPAQSAQPSTPSTTGSLTSEYLQETLKNHRASFFKCYTQLLQKTPGVVGHASLSFTIERTGKISQADIASSNIQDATFRKCLLDALRRVEFRAFSGDPISTIFPLRFE